MTTECTPREAFATEAASLLVAAEAALDVYRGKISEGIALGFVLPHVRHGAGDLDMLEYIEGINPGGFAEGMMRRAIFHNEPVMLGGDDWYHERMAEMADSIAELSPVRQVETATPVRGTSSQAGLASIRDAILND